MDEGTAQTGDLSIPLVVRDLIQQVPEVRIAPGVLVTQQVSRLVRDHVDDGQAAFVAASARLNDGVGEHERVVLPVVVAHIHRFGQAEERAVFFEC